MNRVTAHAEPKRSHVLAESNDYLLGSSFPAGIGWEHHDVIGNLAMHLFIGQPNDPLMWFGHVPRTRVLEIKCSKPGAIGRTLSLDVAIKERVQDGMSGFIKGRDLSEQFPRPATLSPLPHYQTIKASPDAEPTQAPQAWTFQPPYQSMNYCF